MQEQSDRGKDEHVDHVKDESKGPYFPYDRREPYPKRLKVDFRRLPRKTLLTYTAHHDLHVRPDITHEELAIAAARHFAAWRVNEESIMRSFCAGLRSSTLGNGRGLGDDEAAITSRKKRNFDSLDAPSYLDNSHYPSRSPTSSWSESPMRSPSQSPERRIYRSSAGRTRAGGDSRNRARGGGGRNNLDTLSAAALNSQDRLPSRRGGAGGAGSGGSRRNGDYGVRRNFGDYGGRRNDGGYFGDGDYDEDEEEEEDGDWVGRAWNGARSGRGGSGSPLAGSGGRSTIRMSDFVPGEQVAAHTTREDDVGGEVIVHKEWILARVVREFASGTIELRDEDDQSRNFRRTRQDVRHLDDLSGELRKNDRVMAVYPDTTMFYHATVAKDIARMDGNIKVLLVRFEDDEDPNGKSIYRRIPVEHIIFDEGNATSGRNESRNGYSNASGGGGGGGGGSAGARRSSLANGGAQRSTGGAKSRSNGTSSRGVRGGSGAVGDAARGGAVMGNGGRSGAGTGTGGPREQQQGKKPGGTTYADMIAHALGKVEGGRAAFNNICQIIERDFNDGLNWKLESDVRKTPVWRSSVRKILFSNPRFQHAGNTPEDGHWFTMARPVKK